MAIENRKENEMSERKYATVVIRVFDEEMEFHYPVSTDLNEDDAYQSIVNAILENIQIEVY